MANYNKAELAAYTSRDFNDMWVIDTNGLTSLLETYGLFMEKGYPRIERAETLSMLVNVPGGSKPLNLTRSIDGNIHYTQRQITAKFDCFRPSFEKSERKALEKLLHGQWTWFSFLRNGNRYWRGYTEVSISRERFRNVVTIKAVCNPYSYNLTAYLGNDWLWDPFNFEEDTIYTTRTEVKSL